MSDLTVADIVVLLSELDRLRTVAESRLMRMRTASQLLIAEIGAKGAENVDITAGRAVAVIEGLKAELATARRGPVVEWRQMLDGRTAEVTTWASDMGGFQLRVAEKNWRTRSFPGWKGEKPGWAVVFGGQSIAASGPETGPAGKAAAEAAYLKAAGLA